MVYCLLDRRPIMKLDFENITYGDIVKLKSGGPKMTLSSFRASYNQVYCEWFDGGNHKKGTFVMEVLKYAEIDYS